jgi:ABC-2 type transport system permease protein
MGYAAIIAARFRALLQYRAAALGGLFTQIFFGLVRVMILRAFYAASTNAPISLKSVTGYVWLGQATLLLIPWRSDEDVAEQIRTGTIVYELTRPLDLWGTWFARSLAWRTAPVFLRMLPMFAIAMLVVPAFDPGWGLAAPPSVAAFVMWIGCFAGAVMLSAALTALINVTMMWTITGEGVPMLIATFATMFGGLVIPLPLFPDWLKPLLYALPFAGILDLPARVFTGDLSVAQGGLVIAHQLAWTLAFAAGGRYLLSRGLRRLVVQGG